MSFLLEYGLFLAKVVTIVVAIGVVIILVLSAGLKNQGGDSGHITITKLNERFNNMRDALRHALLDEKSLKAEEKAKKKAAKAEKKAEKKFEKKTSEDGVEQEHKKRIFVLDFDGDIKASAVDELRESITAILTVAEARDEVVLKLESGGGMVHSYGLASSQLARITAKGIPLTICVDKVAASGGYMMACVADKIIAAPFAIVGSIGVVAQLPNFNRLLKKHDVDYEMLTAGKYKRTLTMLGENTEEGRKKFIEDLEDTHVLFKEFISEHRSEVDIDAVATGEIWFGKRALDQKLIDEISTSDEYLFLSAENADVFSVAYEHKKTLPEKLGLSASVAVENALTKVWGKLNQRYFS